MMVPLLALTLAAAPLPPQHQGHSMPAPQAPAACTAEHAAMGHCTMPAAPKPSASECTPEHAAMGHCTPPSAPKSAAPQCTPEHAAMGHCTLPSTPKSAGNAPPPRAFPGEAAAAFFGQDVMAAAADALRREHGGMAFNQVMFDLAEMQVRGGRDGYRWEGAAWFGGDIHRVVLKSEGEGDFAGPLGHAEAQLLYSRALDAYANLQLGVRQDLGAGVRRSYASVGVEALAPYWFDVEGTLFLSDKGEVFARAEAYYDQRLTNWWVLQPRGELNLSAQDVHEMGVGAGVTDAEAGLRLRYEVAREFAPYVGVSWERQLGRTARLTRSAGGETGGVSFVAGVRVWF